MSFVGSWWKDFTGIFGGGSPKPQAPAPPGVDAASNASQQNADLIRQRRGLLANIYAGNNAPPPATGKTQLGT